MVSFDLECGKNVCNSYFWYIKILVSILRRDFCLISARFFGCQFLGFERYRLNIRDPLTVRKNQFQAKFNAAKFANRCWPRSTAFYREDTLDRVKLRTNSNQFIFTSCLNSFLWSPKTEFPKNRKKNFLVQLWKIFIFRQIADWNKILFPGHRKKSTSLDLKSNIKYLVLISAENFESKIFES